MAFLQVADDSKKNWCHSLSDLYRQAGQEIKREPSYYVKGKYNHVMAGLQMIAQEIREAVMNALDTGENHESIKKFHVF